MMVSIPKELPHTTFRFVLDDPSALDAPMFKRSTMNGVHRQTR